MNQLIPERCAGLIGLGVMYLWGATLLVWVDWTQSEVIFVKIVGVSGAVLASLIGVATGSLRRECMGSDRCRLIIYVLAHGRHHHFQYSVAET